LTTWS